MHHRDLLVTLELGEEEFDNAYTDCAQYSKVSFWDETYAAETEPFEWYYPYDKFRAVIRSKLQFNDRVLVAGCGNSNILEDMADDGFEQLDGCDFSRIVLDQMRLRCENLPQISFHLESVGDTDFFDESFDGVIDKALFDSMICAEDGPRKVTEYINEVDRILLDTGVFILISHSNPEEVLPYLEQYDIDQPNCSTWIVDVQAVVKPEVYEGEDLDPDQPESLYFIYIASKQEDLVVKKGLKAKKNRNLNLNPNLKHKAKRI